jgi:CelD/BcsL family acetyltransferase involved in cellulose biosynthesis
MADAGIGLVAGVRMARTARSPERPYLKFAVAEADATIDLLSNWVTLAGLSAGDNVFFHPDFALPAMRHLGADVAVATLAHPGTRLAALAPFTQMRLGRIAPAVRLWSHDFAPLGLPLVDRDAVEPTVAALLHGLAPATSGLSFMAADIPLDGLVANALAVAARRNNRPVDILDTHVRAMLARSDPGALDPRTALPAKRRKELGRQMRRLADVGEVRVASVTDPVEVRRRFEQFMALEAEGWKGKSGGALKSSRATMEFASEAVANRADAGAVRIDAIDVGGQPIAMLVTFMMGETAFTWKIAYDESYSRFSPGAQLMLEAAKGIFADPTIARIDSCASADHPMIDHLWSGRMAIGTMVVGPPGGGIVHRVGLATARAELAARAAIRRFRA